MRKPSESATAIDIYAVRPLGQYIAERTLYTSPEYTTPHDPDAIPAPGAQETYRLVTPRRIAALGRLIQPHPKRQSGIPFGYDLADCSRLTLH